MVFEIVNPFSLIFNAIFSEKSCLISKLFLTCLLDVRTLFSRLLNPDWSIQISRAPAVCKDGHAVKVAPYSFSTVRELISKIALSNSTQKSRVRSCIKMLTNMASKFSKCVSRKNCVDRLRFQNIYRMNRRPYLSLE